jgi:hypothetical protein
MLLLHRTAEGRSPSPLPVQRDWSSAWSSFSNFVFLTHDYAPSLMSYGADWEMGVCTGGVRNRRAVAWRTRRASAWPVCQLGVRMDENYMVAALLAMLSLIASVSAAAKLLKSLQISFIL